MLLLMSTRTSCENVASGSPTIARTTGKKRLTILKLTRSTSRRYVTTTRLYDQPIFRFLRRLRKVDFEFASRAVTLLVCRYEREVVTAAQVIHQRLECRGEIIRLVRKNLAAGFFSQ